jgi:hypothetical protein
MPDALQRFCPKKVLGRLADVANQRRNEMSELLIEVEEQPNGQASFIHLSDPASDSLWVADKLLWAVWKTGLTLHSEGNNRLVGLPKRNVVELPDRGQQLVDIEPSDVPGLLHTLGDSLYLTALACYDQHGNMFQVWAHRQRFAAEWQILPKQDFNLHQIWVAGKPVTRQRHTGFGSRRDLFDNEVLGMADAQRLWIAFLAGADRPATCLWRDITQELSKPGHAQRERYRKKEDHPPL